MSTLDLHDVTLTVDVVAALLLRPEPVLTNTSVDLFTLTRRPILLKSQPSYSPRLLATLRLAL